MTRVSPAVNLYSFLLGLYQSNIHATELYFYSYFCVNYIGVFRR